LTEVRKWQVEVLGDDLIAALRNGAAAESPYRE
jgi:hypothetical protein